MPMANLPPDGSSLEKWEGFGEGYCVGLENWKCMLVKERSRFVIEADKLNSAYETMLLEEIWVEILDNDNDKHILLRVLMSCNRDGRPLGGSTTRRLKRISVVREHLEEVCGFHSS